MPNWVAGQKIEEPGIYPGIPLDVYHGDLCENVSVSSTGLNRIFNLSPKHFYDRWYGNPNAAEDEPSSAMILGRAAHHLFTGERNFSKHFVRRPEKLIGEKWHSNRTVCKEWVAQQKAKGLTILTTEQLVTITGMGKALEAEPIVQAGLLRGKAEQSMIAQDAETGLWLKARPDIVPNNLGDFVDLKCVHDVSDDALETAIGTYGYHRQGALICEVASILSGRPLKFSGAGESGFTFTLVFIETERPHCVEIVTLKPSDLQRGQAENRAAMRLLKRCLDRNEWPGPSGHQSDARYLGVKPWVIERAEYRVKQINAMLSV